MIYAIIMGRKTFDSIGKALPNRDNIVISRQPHAPVAGVEFVTGVDEAIHRVKKGETFIIGGASIYGETMDLVGGIYLTRIHQDFQGDAFYPGVPAGFKEVSRQPLQENPLIEVVLYRRS